MPVHSYAIFFMWFITILIITTNIPVFVVTSKLKETSEATRITMISLAVTDLTIGILSMLRLSYFASSGRYQLADDLTCTLDGLTQLYLGGVSITTIMYLCIDRVITIKYSLHYPIYFTRKTVTCINMGIWLYIGLVCIFAEFVLGMEMAMMKEALFCCFIPKYRSAVTLMIVILGFVVPAIVILICAVILFKIVRKQVIQIAALEGPDSAPQAQSMMRHKRAIITIFCMVTGYYICWSPLMVLLTWSYFYGNTYHPTTEAVLAWFAMCNSAINSLVYLPTIKEYREIFKQIFRPNIFNSQVAPN